MKSKPQLFENGVKVRTGLVRCSYPNLFTARAAREGDREAYSVSLLIPKDDRETIDVINQAIENAKKQGLEKMKGWTAATLKHPKFHNPLRDGDEDKPDQEEYQGMHFVNAKSYNKKPLVLDGAKNKIEDPEEVYAGCWVAASLSFFPFDVSGTKGIGCGLNGVMKMRDDEPFGGGGNTVNDFEAEEESEADDFLN